MFSWKYYTVTILLIGTYVLLYTTKYTPIPQQITTLPFYTAISSNSSTYSYPMSTLPLDDRNRLINITNFHFQIINSPCNESSPLLLILCHSAPKNWKKRKTIRETWGTWGQRKESNVKIVFMVGDTNNTEEGHRLQEENRIFKDIAQGNFIDSYKNLTYKHVMVFKYAIYHCPQAKYILKTDDDVFVYIPVLMEFLQQVLSPFGAKDLLLCTPYRNPKVIRSYRSKWRASFKEYPGRYYPDYCPGWALLYSQDVLFRIYKEAQSSKYFWIDDVHITGTMAERLGILHTELDTFRTNDNVKFSLFGQPNLSEQDIRDLWKSVAKMA